MFVFSKYLVTTGKINTPRFIQLLPPEISSHKIYLQRVPPVQNFHCVKTILRVL